MKKLEKTLKELPKQHLFSSVDDMVKELSKDRQDHPIKNFFLDIWYVITRKYGDIRWFIKKDIPHRIKWGCSEMDIWSLDYSLSVWILKRLKALKHWFEENGGIPCDYMPNENPTKDEYTIAKSLWICDIDKMILAFELIVEESDGDGIDTVDYNPDKQKMYDEGWNLFAKYFRNLWT